MPNAYNLPDAESPATYRYKINVTMSPAATESAAEIVISHGLTVPAVVPDNERVAVFNDETSKSFVVVALVASAFGVIASTATPNAAVFVVADSAAKNTRAVNVFVESYCLSSDKRNK